MTHKILQEIPSRIFQNLTQLPDTFVQRDRAKDCATRQNGVSVCFENSDQVAGAGGCERNGHRLPSFLDLALSFPLWGVALFFQVPYQPDLTPKLRNKNQPKEEVSVTDIPLTSRVIQADVHGQKLPQNAKEIMSIFQHPSPEAAEVHQKNFGQKLGLLSLAWRKRCDCKDVETQSRPDPAKKRQQQKTHVPKIAPSPPPYLCFSSLFSAQNLRIFAVPHTWRSENGAVFIANCAFWDAQLLSLSKRQKNPLVYRCTIARASLIEHSPCV